VNKSGYDVSRDIPVSSTGAGAVAALGSLGLNFSIFRNNLSVSNLLTVSLF
jgi:hypothetical protein